MAKYYGISGTPWHVERVHNEDPDDSRRHRSRCAHYDKESKRCKKAYGMCVGASHCNMYREKRADTVEYEEPNKLIVSNVSSSKYDGFDKMPVEKQEDIPDGSLIVSNGIRYIVLKRNLVQNKVVSYLCQRVQIIPRLGVTAKSNQRWIYKDYFLADNEIHTIYGNSIQKTELIPIQYRERFLKRKAKSRKASRNVQVFSATPKKR